MKPLRAVSLAVSAAFLITSCGLPSSVPVQTTIEGILVDPSNEPLAGAVIYAPTASGISVGDATKDQTGTDTCEVPSVDHVARTCTDENGAFSISLSAPLSGTLSLVAKRWHRSVDVDVTLEIRVPDAKLDVGNVKQPSIDPDDELAAAVSYALPSLAAFKLIAFDDEDILSRLRGHTRSSFTEKLSVGELPILQPDDNAVETLNAIAYRFEPRAQGIQDCAYDPATNKDGTLDTHTDCEDLPTLSQTFRGMPEFSDTEIQGYLDSSAEQMSFLEDETTYQLSVLNIIGDELDFTYYGLSLAAPSTPSSLQGLESVLEISYPQAEVTRLLGLTEANYLLHNQVDLDVDYIKASIPDELDYAHDDDASSQGLTPANHYGESDSVRTIRMVAVADPTVKNVDDDTTLPGYYGRVDAMVNRMDLFYRYVQISFDDPGSNTTLTRGNLFLLRAELVEHRHLTSGGIASHSFPADGCGSSSDYLTNLRNLSASTTSVDNEFWMWFTNTSNYSGLWGCMYVNGMGSAPNSAAVGFTSVRNYTLETVGQTLMHEVGHNLNAVHSVAPSSHQCRIIGFIPFGVTGPGIMGGTSDRNLRTNCFGATSSSDTAKRNLTRIAETVHGLANP